MVTDIINKTMVQALFIVLHFFGVVRSEELHREMVKFQGFKENVNTRRSTVRLQALKFELAQKYSASKSQHRYINKKNEV